jgi:hypothetical protein
MDGFGFSHQLRHLNSARCALELSKTKPQSQCFFGKGRPESKEVQDPT